VLSENIKCLRIERERCESQIADLSDRLADAENELNSINNRLAEASIAKLVGGQWAPGTLEWPCTKKCLDKERNVLGTCIYDGVNDIEHACCLFCEEPGEQ
jgi:hypothetical protein